MTTPDAVEVDARGLACPLPVIRLAAAVDAAADGALVRLLADDPAARVDVPVWCRMKRHRLVSVSDEDAVAVFVVEKRRT
jgi:tRNA 2-thiouridine synthesizing protein A